MHFILAFLLIIIFSRIFSVNAIRHGAYKAHYITTRSCGIAPPVFHDPPLLFNIQVDPSEQYPLDPDQHQQLIQTFNAALDKHNKEVHPAPPVDPHNRNKKYAFLF